jgi:hypothetical protein
MHVHPFLHKKFSSVMHSKRLDTLKEMVVSALRNKRLSVTGLGRGLEGNASERSNIRKSDRFIGNNKLISERRSIYETVTNLLTDAGFHNPLFQEVQHCGWDYIGRIRGKKCYSFNYKLFFYETKKIRLLLICHRFQTFLFRTNYTLKRANY